jgi:hypothetical protein
MSKESGYAPRLKELSQARVMRVDKFGMYDKETVAWLKQ